ncbi:MAG: OmpA family protein [Acetobacteraceae bacterium]|nr:OmpA family protein [Acetobacteraceae bacterium]
MRYRGALLATALLAIPLLAIPGVAKAQPIQGLYIGAGVGATLPQDPRISAGSVFGGQSHLNENLGFIGLGSIGYGLGNGARFEIEGDFGRNGINELGGTRFPTKADGTVQTYGVMANALFDMDIGVPYLYPYIGVGAGYQWTNLNNTSFTGNGFRFGTNDTSGAFAGQAIIGASLPIPNMPGLSATVDYRFMDILGGQKFHGVENVGSTGSFESIQMHNQFNHSIIFGVRYAFNTPAPAQAAPTPVAAPAPAPARSYLVFFDWDKANLTDRARQIIREAADNSTHVQYTRLEVNGYTDTSGTPQYNQGLSVRRAQAVAGELVRDGVPRNAIAIQGFGDTHLLVPTGAGVREPQNRRVEIIIH